MHASSTPVPAVRLGTTGPTVSRLALGCMGMSGMYGATSDAESIATIHAALDRGITMLDTGDFYGMGHNEDLIRRALTGRRDQVVLSVKFGALRTPDGGWSGVDTRPAAIKNFAAYSLQRLGVEVIDVYRPARLDPQVPIEDTIGAMADLVKQGYVRHIGLSEVGVDTIARAHAVHPIADLQIEYSILSRNPESNIFGVLRELGIGATLYGVLSRGLLTGSKPQGPTDFRQYLPRFAGDRNEDLVQRFASFAAETGRTPAEVAIGWVLAKQPSFVPVVGARKVAQLDDAWQAVERPLSSAEVERVEATVPRGAAAGPRYAPEQMAHLDSER